MKGLTRRWVLADSPPGLPSPAAGGFAPLLQRVLTARGMTDPEAVRRFCDPRLTDLAPPELMPNIDRAAGRLVEAVRQGERIAIYGDYDVDGITATAVLFHTLRVADPAVAVESYVPHRLDEGYGLNPEALRQLGERGVDVVVSVDCGVTGFEAARAARVAGLDLIITDHHNLAPGSEGLPEAYAVVHPRLPGSVYPFGELCGAGVAFKLAWRFATIWCGSPRVSEAFQRTLLDMLPLVALGTIADVVPLVGENRILASAGLRLIKQTRLPGLRALIEASELAGEHIDAEKVGFVLGPRLNACGRMGHASEAVRMLTDAPPEEARRLAEGLARHNRQRQQTQRSILEQAEQMAVASGMTGEDRRIIVLAHPDWHPGVVGVVCSRLAERFGRPAVLLQEQGDLCKGSARSIEGYSIHDGLAACAEHLTSFGGHHAAAGVTLPTAVLSTFTDAITAHANAGIAVDQLTPILRIDCDAVLHELDMETVTRIGSLSPFGRDNVRPTIRIRGAVVAEPPQQMGANGRHLMLRLRQDDGTAGRRVLRTVWWSAGPLAERIAAGMQVDVAIEPKINCWKGRTSVEAEVRDVIVHGGNVETSKRRNVETS